MNLQRCNYSAPPPIGERSIAMSVCVCMCACLSVRDHISVTTRLIFTKFVCSGRSRLLRAVRAYWAAGNSPGVEVARTLWVYISVDKSVACTCRHVPARLHVGLRSDMNNSHRSNCRAQHLSMNGRKLMQHIGPFKAEGAIPPHLNLAPNVPKAISGK